MTKKIGQKYQIGQIVKEANAFGKGRDNFGRRTGVIKDVLLKKNKAGVEHIHYLVVWEGHVAPTERVQHRLSAL